MNGGAKSTPNLFHKRALKMKNYLLAILLFSLLPGCSWVNLSPKGESVRVVSETAVLKCKHLGKAGVNVVDRIAGIYRSYDAMEAELAVLGRNSAAQMGGDTVVPLTDIVNGEQTFGVYRCINP